MIESILYDNLIDFLTHLILDQNGIFYAISSGRTTTEFEDQNHRHHHWAYIDGRYVLVAVATGIIAQILLSHR